MFPLPRMLEYGNTRSVPYIKQMQFGFSSSVTNMILLSTGDAYVGGANSYGQLGLGDKSDRPRQLFRVQEPNIKMIACSVGSTMYITQDNKIFLSGDRAILNNSGTVAGWSTYTDISSYFSTINIADIKKISHESTTFVLMNNGDLYGLVLTVMVN